MQRVVLMIILLEMRLLRIVTASYQRTGSGLNPYSTGNEVVAGCQVVALKPMQICLNPYSTGNEVVALNELSYRDKLL